MPRVKAIIITLSIAVLVVATAAYLRPLPQVVPTLQPVKLPASEAITLPWPSASQSALGAQGYGLLETNGTQTAGPIASITKVITALAILEKKPLPVGQLGPSITLGSSDVDLFEDYFIRGGSVVKVQDGEEISQQDALRAMLIPSGNNMADSLAIWAFGSLEAYTNYANKMLAQMGLEKTHVADASGFSPDSVSTAEELVKIGERVLANPVLAEIVSQKTATVPTAGEISNVNWALGQSGVIGIKTGNTDEAGGCFLFAARRDIDGQDMVLIGATLGAPTRNNAISDSLTLVGAADSGFAKQQLLRDGQAVAQYQAPWGASAVAVVNLELAPVLWRNQKLTTQLDLRPIRAESKKNQDVGKVVISAGDKKISQEVVLAEKLTGPSWWWRIFHF